MHAATGIAQSFGQPRLDRRVPIFMALVEDKAARAKILRQGIQLMLQCGGLIEAHHTDIRQAFHMRLAGRDVVQEKLAVEQYIVAGEETHDPRIGFDACLLPQKIAHRDCLPDGFVSNDGSAASACSAASTVSSRRSPLARCLSSTRPPSSPRGPTTNCHGSPIRSILENLAPARSSVSS